MNKPVLHLIGLPHTRTTDQFSHCAFTGKIRRMGLMMRSLGYTVLHYGVGESISGSSADIPMIRDDEQVSLLGFDPTAPGYEYAYQHVRVDTPLYQTFNDRLAKALQLRVAKNDLVLHTFGNASACVFGKHEGIDIESGVGYDDPWSKWRVYESYAHMHWVLGKKNEMPSIYNWVIPNYFDPREWTTRTRHGSYVLFLGRIATNKGIHIFTELAKHRPDLQFIMCGQGDTDIINGIPNIKKLPPVHGRERDELIGNALCIICASSYVEPFGGVAVEAMMTGTPVLASPWGAFMETINHGYNGFRCRMLSDWLKALDEVHNLNRANISNGAKHKYSMFNLAKEYDTVFRAISGVHGEMKEDWYNFPSTI